MKFWVIILFIFPALLFSQIDTLSLSYYPLDLGNYWQYSCDVSQMGSNPYTYYFSREVISDTSLPNGLKYYLIEKKFIPDTGITEYYFERIDTIKCNSYIYSTEYNDEILLDNLKSQIGDSIWNSYRKPFGYIVPSPLICGNIYQDTLLNFITNVKYFFDADYTIYYDYKLAQDLGFIQERYFDWEGFETNLEYAKINNNEYGQPLSIINNNKFPNKINIYQNYPNPFNSRTVIPFELPNTMNLEINIFDISGRKICEIFKGKKSTGYHEIVWDGRQFTSGVYYYQIKSQNYIQTKKLILIK